MSATTTAMPAPPFRRDGASGLLLPAHGWTPRAYQTRVWDYLQSGGRRACLNWARRSGKDELALHWAAVAMHVNVGTYWHMLPKANQSRKAIWDAVNPRTGRRRIDDAFPPELRETVHEQEMFIRFRNGSTWQVLGSDNHSAFVGSPPSGVVFSEYALADPQAWDFVRPILAENRGWALFVSTPRGHNHFEKLALLAQSSPEWLYDRHTADDNPHLTPETLEAEHEEMVALLGDADGEALFQQEYYCSFSGSVAGSIYGIFMERAEREGRIGTVAPDPQRPVNVAFDLGMDDDTALWFHQDCGTHVRFLHTYSARGEALQHYAEYIDDWCRAHALRFGRAILPHDARVREMGTGVTRQETLEAAGLRTEIAPNQRLADGIQATRNLLAIAWFDAQGCEEGLKALREYHRDLNPLTSTYYARPVHDASSHLCDALRYRAVTPPDNGSGWADAATFRARPVQKATAWI